MITHFGITGGLASGKSSAAVRFAELGAAVTDADDVSRALTAAGGEAVDAVRAAFGDDVFNAVGGDIDRVALRAATLGRGEIRRLEAILHPLIRGECLRRMSDAAAPYGVLVVPLLFETGFLLDTLARTATVECAEAIRRERMRERAWTDDEIQTALAAQLPDSARRARADDVIPNDGTLDDLNGEIDRLHAVYLSLAGHAPDTP